MAKKKLKPSDGLSADQRLVRQLRTLPKKPFDSASVPEKKAYSESLSQCVALAIASELRNIGLDTTRPTEPGLDDKSGAERRMSGGLGAKKVDVTWATDVAGLLFGVSIKSINFRDSKTKNFQKNLTNRRGDMLFESVTLHRRFPYAVLFGMFFLDAGARSDGTGSRESTFQNAHEHFALFSGRDDPADRDEQYERLYIILIDANSENPAVEIFLVGETKKPITLHDVLQEAIHLLSRRNPDFYRVLDGKLTTRSKRAPVDR